MSVVRTRLRVEGVVQGVGFRPFAHALATRLALGGLVGNDSDGVFVEVEGDAAAVGAFQDALHREAPPLAVIERVTAEQVVPLGERAFSIVASRAGPVRHTLVSPDTATCAACLAEIADPRDRRYRHPFASCTHCGPRFTIVTDVPYDRPATTMAGFPMCPDCTAEYTDPADRRFHAQPICCPACGPTSAAARRGRLPRRRRPGRRGSRAARRRRGARRQGPGRFPHRGGCGERGGRGDAAIAQAPRGQAVRGAGARPGRGPQALRARPGGRGRA